MYNFLHGFPTLVPGSFFNDDDVTTHCKTECVDDLIDHPVLGWVRQSWIEGFVQRGLQGHELNSTECEECGKVRDSRRRVLRLGQEKYSEIQQHPFLDAPAVFACNVPKYFAVLLRAREYAKLNHLQLSWCAARDIPLFRDDRDLPEEQLHAKRCKWLEKHDQQTSHLSSLFPLVGGLPVRLTDSIDRRRKLYRGRRGHIVGWAPHPAETREEVDGELLLSHPPEAIYVKFPGATWRISEDLDVGVYPVTSVSRSWKVNTKTGVSARRTGFFLIPDFGSTAHMIQGQTLDGVLPDAESHVSPAGPSTHIGAYIGFSRVKTLQGVWILRPFSPFLFTAGSPPGPDILMKKLRGEITGSCEELLELFGADLQTKATDPMQAEYMCTQCLLNGSPDYMKKAKEFGVTTPAELLTKILMDGAWTRCQKCVGEAIVRRKKPQAPSTMTREQLQVNAALADEEADNERGECTICGQSKPRTQSHFPATMLHNWQRNANVLRCRQCHICNMCKKVHASRHFSHGSQTCIDCEVFACAACKEDKTATRYGTQALKDHRHRGDRLVCDACRGRGCTPKDPKLYSCTSSFHEGGPLGQQKFDYTQLHNHKVLDRKLLVCSECHKKEAQAEKDLKKRISASETKCKCKTPSHDDKCKLSSFTYGKRRHEGDDLGVTLEDLRWLRKRDPEYVRKRIRTFLD